MWFNELINVRSESDGHPLPSGFSPLLSHWREGDRVFGAKVKGVTKRLA